MLDFGMNSQQAAAANAAMSNGTTFDSFHIFISSLIAFTLVSFLLGCLIIGYNHFADNEIALDKFLKLVVSLAVLFILFGIFLVV
jgi:hypothetical protein